MRAERVATVERGPRDATTVIPAFERTTPAEPGLWRARWSGRPGPTVGVPSRREGTDDGIDFVHWTGETLLHGASVAIDSGTSCACSERGLVAVLDHDAADGARPARLVKGGASFSLGQSFLDLGDDGASPRAMAWGPEGAVLVVLHGATTRLVATHGASPSRRGTFELAIDAAQHGSIDFVMYSSLLVRGTGGDGRTRMECLRFDGRGFDRAWAVDVPPELVAIDLEYDGLVLLEEDDGLYACRRSTLDGARFRAVPLHARSTKPGRASSHANAGRLLTTQGENAAILCVDDDTLELRAELPLTPPGESATPLAFVAEDVLLVEREDRLEAWRIIS